MSKFDTSLKGRGTDVHSSQYKASNFKDASSGRVMKEGKKTIAQMSRPEGRTSYDAGSKVASCNAK
jgi:hypothetical protein